MEFPQIQAGEQTAGEQLDQPAAESKNRGRAGPIRATVATSRRSACDRSSAGCVALLAAEPTRG